MSFLYLPLLRIDSRKTHQGSIIIFDRIIHPFVKPYEPMLDFFGKLLGDFIDIALAGLMFLPLVLLKKWRHFHRGNTEIQVGPSPAFLLPQPLTSQCQSISPVAPFISLPPPPRQRKINFESDVETIPRAQVHPIKSNQSRSASLAAFQRQQQQSLLVSSSLPPILRQDSKDVIDEPSKKVHTTTARRVAPIALQRTIPLPVVTQDPPSIDEVMNDIEDIPIIDEMMNESMDIDLISRPSSTLLSIPSAPLLPSTLFSPAPKLPGGFNFLPPTPSPLVHLERSSPKRKALEAVQDLWDDQHQVFSLSKKIKEADDGPREMEGRVSGTRGRKQGEGESEVRKKRKLDHGVGAIKPSIRSARSVSSGAIAVRSISRGLLKSTSNINVSLEETGPRTGRVARKDRRVIHDIVDEEEDEYAIKESTIPVRRKLSAVIPIRTTQPPASLLPNDTRRAASTSRLAPAKIRTKDIASTKAVSAMERRAALLSDKVKEKTAVEVEVEVKPVRVMRSTRLRRDQV